MGVRILQGDCRDEKGRFVKGYRPSPETEFKPGQHWRSYQPFRDQAYLFREYVENQRSASDIGSEWGIKPESILFWLRKHEIPRRSVSEARKVKHWGVSGEANPMFGRNGSANPMWRGGCTPERQGFYASIEWQEAVKAVWARDKGKCQRCGRPSHDRGSFHIHHIVSFAVKHLRAELTNLLLLCEPCHDWVHSKKNTAKEFIREGVIENGG